MVQATFMTRFSDMSRDSDIRLDEKFHRKLTESGFEIVKGSDYPSVQLSELLIESRERFRYREGEVYGGIPTGASRFTEDGEILEKEEVTLHDHPGRLEMAVRVNDIIISRLKGSKSPVILASGNHPNFVWSNGFIILRPRENRFLVKFLYYVMKSRFFRSILDENLSRGIGISAYFSRDILRLRVPAVPLEIQEKVVEEAENIEARIKEIRSSIPDIPRLIEKVFMEEFEGEEEINQNEKNTGTFISSFSDIGQRKNLRCDVKYTSFFRKTKSKVFLRIENLTPLKDALEPHPLPVVRKGFLKESMVLVDKEGVLPKSGTIISREFVDRIDSDKVLFGDSDLLVSKIDPFLGHVIRNQKNEPMIGTTEFLGLKVKSGSDVDFMRYSMLSDAFLESTRFLVSGKRQPRISSYDLLSIRMPVPDIKRQREISRKISARIGDLKEKMRIIESLRNEIDDMVKASLIGE